MQHPYNYDGKETLLHSVATIGAEMNQQTNIIFPQLVTSSIASSMDTSKSVESFPHIPAYVPSSSALFLRWDTADSLEAPSFVTNIAQIWLTLLHSQAKFPAIAFTMDQIVFHLYLLPQPKNTERFLIQLYLLKRKTFKDMLKGSRTLSTPMYCFQH
jgi:hypothetical protein